MPVTRICGLVAIVVAIGSLAQQDGPHFASNSPEDFVRGFYAWYAPHALHDHEWDKTLQLIHSDLSPQLARLLQEDSVAQSKCEDVVGLDFDPFLNTQDPAEHYAVNEIVQIKTAYQAKIYRLEDGKQAEKPDVIAEFAQKNGRWLFTNFYYPGADDLLTLLKSRPHCSAPRK